MVMLLAVYVLRVPPALCVPLAMHISFVLHSLRALGLLSWLSLMQLSCLGEVVQTQDDLDLATVQMWAGAAGPRTLAKVRCPQ